MSAGVWQATADAAAEAAAAAADGGGGGCAACSADRSGDAYDDSDIDALFASLFDAEEWREFEFALPGALGTVRALGWSQGGCDGLWSAAALHVAAAPPARERLCRARRILELGAGCGALSVACATRLGVPAGAMVHVTDGDAREVHLLNANAERAEADGACECAIVAQQLLWGAAAARASDIPARSCDVVLAAECCYVPEMVPLLAETLAYFMADDGRAYVVNSFVSTSRTQAEVRECLEASLRVCGLAWRDLSLPTDERALEGAGKGTLYALEVVRA